MSQEDDSSGSGELRISEMFLGDERLLVISFPTSNVALPDSLTKAEDEVARMLLRGLSNREIAEARGTAVRTVANQIAALYRKMNVSTRAEFAHAAAGRDAHDDQDASG